MNAKTYMLGCLKNVFFGCGTYSGPQIEAWLRKRNPGCPETLWQRIVKASEQIREIRKELIALRTQNAHMEMRLAAMR